ncbi:MAG: aminotransferase class V-fold PLP-dependent enzyme [Planctomycetia bacterium]|nr:aminotransferase class V-fold PLP-dependent enzyme [Planctomycetia bacterium]
MSPPSRIYLDNAATSWPKPPAVYDAVDRYQRELGAPAGRGTYAEATSTNRLVDATRLAVAQLLGVREPKRVVFTFNGTDALNLAIHGVLRPGDHVVTSVVEHNSVLRPLRELEISGGVQVTRVGCDDAGRIDPDDVAKAFRPNSRLVALTHASNVTGAVQPIAEIGAICRQRDVLLLVDAAQTLGHIPIDVDQLGADLLAAPGHKGTLGPLGTGLLYVSALAEPHLRTVRQGGTGTRSEEDRQPDSLPDRFEAGNHNVPGIVGLGAGIAYLQQTGIENVASHISQLTQRLAAGFLQIEGVTLFGPHAAADRAGILSITIQGFEPQEAAAVLDAEYRIQVRSGIHCAPLMHERLGTLATGGTVRFSPGPFNTTQEIDAAVQAVAELAAGG